MSRRALLRTTSTVLGAAAAAACAPAPAPARPAPPATTPRHEAWPVDYTHVPVPPVNPRYGLLELPDARLAYSDTGGSGAAVVFLHGRSGSLHSWPYQQDDLARQGFRVVAYSRRGHEGSTHTDVGYSTDDLVALLDHLGLGRANLVGHAAGGVPALDAALARPDRVLSLAVVCSTIGIKDDQFAATVASLRSPEFEAMPSVLRELGPSYRSADPDGVRQWHEIEQRALTGKFFVQRLRSAMDWAAVGAATTPTLLVTTDADSYMTPPLADRVAARMRQAEHTTIIGSGHCPHWERPGVFNQVVVDFVRRNNP